MILVSEGRSGEIVYSGVAPDDSVTAIGTVPGDRAIFGAPVRNHAFRLVAHGSDAGLVSVLLVNPAGRRRVVFRPFTPPDIDQLFPDADASVSKRVYGYRMKRTPGLVPESLRKLPAPAVPDGATFGGRDRTWYLGASTRDIYLWAGNGGAGGPGANVRDEGLATAILPAEAPNHPAGRERIQGVRPKPIVAVRAMTRDGQALRASATVRGQAYDIYIPNAKGLSYLEFTGTDGSITRGSP